MDPTIEVELEFVPTSATMEYRRDAVTQAAGAAGLVIHGWSTGRRADQRNAVPSLDIRVTSRLVTREYRRGDLTRAVADQLIGFCTALRRNVPELPFGIIEQMGRTVTWFGFRLHDQPEEIERGLAALVAGDALPRGKAFGWDAASGSWLRL